MIFIIIILSIILLIGLIIGYLAIIAYYIHPSISNTTIESLKRYEIEKDFFVLGPNRLKLSRYNHWEMYVEGKAYERGIIIGKLTKELMAYQEDVFITEIKKLVPNKYYLKVLMVLVAWLNRNISKHISKEYKYELYGLSLSAPYKYKGIASAYFRMVNYIAAHDIGHAMMNMHLVGCSSFSVKGNKTIDSKIFIGRNFDFYFGDDFSRKKIIAFYNPMEGYKFATVTWGGMIGVISGMNIKGLTVSINGAEGKIPLSISTPVSILVREILQYASNIEEAYSIAKKRKVIMSESIMIGSSGDNTTAIIEKSGNKTILYNPKEDVLICTNHFQSPELKVEKKNVLNIKNGSTYYRFKQIEELIKNETSITPKGIAEILRNRFGINNKDVGNGNEKVVNQLLAHHSIIFKPHELKFWVSSQDFTLGEYVCYDLNKVFECFPNLNENDDISEKELKIPADEYLKNGYINYLNFKEEILKIKNINSPEILTDSEIDNFIKLNPEYYQTYLILADYFYKINECEKSLKYYKLSLEKEYSSEVEKNNTLKIIKKIEGLIK